MIRLLPFFALFLSLNSWASGSSVHRAALESLTCDTAREVVEEKGDVVFRFRKDLLSRVVKNSSFCDHDQMLRRFDYDVRDTRGCHVGYVCTVRDTL